MTLNDTALQDELKTILKKSSYLTKREIDALWNIIRCLIGSSSFSLKKVVKRIKARFSRNFLALVLKKFSYIQERVFKQLVEKITQQLHLRDKIELLLDDTLVKKQGKKIFGSLVWFDHSNGQVVQSMCLVNVGLAINGDLVVIFPFLLKMSDLEKSKSHSKYSSQDPKTKAGITLIHSCISYFEEFNVSKKQVLILVDSWYCTKPFKDFLLENKLNFRMDSRSNLSVQQPDFEALTNRHVVKRGRKRKKWVKYVNLNQYFDSLKTTFYFKEKHKNDSIKAKRAVITLRTHGRVVMYAFYSDKYENPKFIMIKSQLKNLSSAKTIYHEYLIRWKIETAHRELKQQFCLGKNQTREQWTVMGFIGLIYFSYSLFKTLTSKLFSLTGHDIKCPTWSEEFHIDQIIYDYKDKT